MAKIWKGFNGCGSSYAGSWVDDQYRKSIPLINPDWTPLVTTGGVIENIGWAIIGNLHILFALAIGGSWAKERAGGAFAAGISFILINRITGAIFGVTSDMLANEDAFTHTLFGTKIMVKGFLQVYWKHQL